MSSYVDRPFATPHRRCHRSSRSTHSHEWVSEVKNTHPPTSSRFQSFNVSVVPGTLRFSGAPNASRGSLAYWFRVSEKKVELHFFFLLLPFFAHVLGARKVAPRLRIEKAQLSCSPPPRPSVPIFLNPSPIRWLRAEDFSAARRSQCSDIEREMKFSINKVIHACGRHN